MWWPGEVKVVFHIREVRCRARLVWSAWGLNLLGSSCCLLCSPGPVSVGFLGLLLYFNV